MKTCTSTSVCGELYSKIIQLFSEIVSNTSMIVSNASLFVLMTERVSSQHLLKTPSTPVIPMPSIMSLVSLNGTCHKQPKQ